MTFMKLTMYIHTYLSSWQYLPRLYSPIKFNLSSRQYLPRLYTSINFNLFSRQYLPRLLQPYKFSDSPEKFSRVGYDQVCRQRYTKCADILCLAQNMYLSTSVSVAHLSPLTLGTSLALQYRLFFSKCKTSQFYPYITFTSLVNGHLFRLDPLSKLPVQRNIRFS